VNTDTEAGTAASKLAGSIIFTLLSWAFVVWLGGIALYHGFGVSAPFVPTFLAVWAGATAVKILTLTIAKGWNDAKVEAAPKIAAAEYVGQRTAASLMQAPDLGDIFKTLTDSLGESEGK
jgi:hypothetical protein